MKLRDLVDDSGLGLSLVYGEPAMDRPIKGVFTTDLLDPSRYLTDGVLVLSGLMWRREPADSDAFVRALATAGVAALGAGEAAFGMIPDDVVAACRRHEVALVRVPVEVSFGRISEVVSAAQQTASGRLLAAALGRQHRLLAAIAEGRSLDDVLALVGGETGVACRVLTPTGRQVAAAAPQLDAVDVDRVSRAFLTADRLPVSVGCHDGSEVSIIAGDSRLDRRLTAWFLVCDGDHRQWSDESQVTLRELATLIALEHRRWDEDRRARRRIADEVIALVATGQSAGAEVAVRLADLGADPGGRCLVAAASGTGPDSLETTHAVLHDAVLQVAEQPVTGVYDGRVVAILTGWSATDRDLLRTALTRLAPGVGDAPIAVGLSAQVGSEAMSGALDEALHAVRLAALRKAAVSVVTSDEVTSHLLLLGTVPDEVRRTFAVRVLGPVLAHDGGRGGDLLRTLDAFLRADGSWSRCARAMHVHVNTVRYRVRRVEELTGRDLSRLEDRVDVFLALRSLRSPGPGTGPG